MSPETQKALNDWLSVDSWNSGHALDDARFARFFWTAFKHEPDCLDRSTLESAIRSAYEKEKRQITEYAASEIGRFCDLYVTFTELVEVGQKEGCVLTF